MDSRLDQIEFSEENYISESSETPPLRRAFWGWVLLLVLFFGFGGYWYQSAMRDLQKAAPFLQVTNRELSLFLWQNPEYMRVNAKEKSNYLPGFKYIDRVTLELGQSEHYAIAPPDLLFRYHTWRRLIFADFIPLPILKEEFLHFISYVEEWHPKYWPNAPQEYQELLTHLSDQNIEDLSILPLTALPIEVRMAFQGWRNYFKEKESINQFSPTISLIKEFLEQHPFYSRNFWQNLYPNYLKNFEENSSLENQEVDSRALTGFLRVALYNYLANRGKTIRINRAGSPDR